MGFVLLDNLGVIDASEELTAQPSDCLVGYSAIFANSNGQIQSGTMNNSTRKSQAYDCQNTVRQTQIVDIGYHDGSEKISVNPIPKTTTTSSTYILKNKKAYISDGLGNIQLITGTAGR